MINNQIYPINRSNAVRSHLKNWNSAETPGLTAGLAWPT
jgi:hypothetical protein